MKTTRSASVTTLVQWLLRHSFALCGLLAVLSISMRPAFDSPVTEITNGLVRAQLYLPDAETGYYRGTRFDWAGVVASLEYKGHTYHGKWFDTYSPTLHDAIMGPVEEFGPLGYTDIKPGGTFVKIGVGSLTRPDEKPYNAFTYYPIANPGVWTITKKADQVQFVHTLADTAYAYSYRKTLTLTKNKPELVIKHSLKNTGNRAIETTSYNHNFFVIDQQPTGPGYAIKFPMSALSTDGGKGVTDRVRFQNGQLVYLSDLAKGETVYYPNLANGQSMRYNLTVDNTKTGAGVTVTGDRDISRMVYWSSSTTVSPEPYVTIKIEPGQTFSWQIAYQYYVN
ncbi:hypothetical protein [Spirosoma aerolatum]|uniref:hypothetical protein n=1 Tax=Spirosoma aerolatum TaxID=1211326 RepID=UPI001FE83F23|nr:hypothetical protein [Spirosoma aerolatum]